MNMFTNGEGPSIPFPSKESKLRYVMSKVSSQGSHKDHSANSVVIENEQERIGLMMRNARRRLNALSENEAVRSNFSPSLTDTVQTGSDVGRAIDQCVKKTIDMIRDASTILSQQKKSSKSLRVLEVHQDICSSLEDSATWILLKPTVIGTYCVCEDRIVKIEPEILGCNTTQISSTNCSLAGADKLPRESQSCETKPGGKDPKIRTMFESNGKSHDIGKWKNIGSIDIAVSWYIHISFRSFIIRDADLTSRSCVIQ